MNFATPAEAETAFYRAIERRDLDTMMQVWSHEDAISCIHPMGGPMSGPRAVRESWAHIFRADPEMSFRVTALHCSQGPMIAVHVVYEYIAVGGETTERQPMIATNVYRLHSDGWKMMLHHASPVPATSHTRSIASLH